MTPEEFYQLLKTELQGLNATVERIPPKKESSGTHTIQFLTVNYPRSQPTSPSKSSSPPADD